MHLIIFSSFLCAKWNLTFCSECFFVYVSYIISVSKVTDDFFTGLKRNLFNASFSRLCNSSFELLSFQVLVDHILLLSSFSRDKLSSDLL